MESVQPSSKHAAANAIHTDKVYAFGAAHQRHDTVAQRFPEKSTHGLRNRKARTAISSTMVMRNYDTQSQDGLNLTRSQIGFSAIKPRYHRA